MPERPVIYHIPVCPFSQRVEILLELKGLRDRVDFHVVDITKPREPWLLELTRGTTALPVMQDEQGRVLKESLVLLRYFDERFPRRAGGPDRPVRACGRAADDRAGRAVRRRRLHHGDEPRPRQARRAARGASGAVPLARRLPAAAQPGRHLALRPLRTGRDGVHDPDDAVLVPRLLRGLRACRTRPTTPASPAGAPPASPIRRRSR